jgi:uncharacterized membrane protein
MSLPPDNFPPEENPFEGEPIRLPEEPIHLPSPRARRRRRNTILVRPDMNSRAELMENLARRAFPTFEFFLYSAICGAIIGVGFIVDAQALLIFGALIAPLMLPWVGLAYSTVTGSVRYFAQTLGGFLIAAILILVTGLLAGLAVRPFMPLPFNQAFYHSRLWWPDLIVLVIGALLLTTSFVRLEEKPILPSIMLTYELYLPLSAAGFGLGSGVPHLWPDGALVFLVHLALATLIGVGVLLVSGFRPMTFAGYTLGTTVSIMVVITLLALSGIGTMLTTNTALPVPPLTPTTMPTATQTPVSTNTPPHTVTPSATQTLGPTETPSLTPTPTRVVPTTPAPTSTSTPLPTPVYARIYAKKFGGALVRKEPGGPALTTLANDILVEVLPEIQDFEGSVWVHIVASTPAGTVDGWVIRDLLITATPAPNWEPSPTSETTATAAQETGTTATP